MNPKGKKPLVRALAAAFALGAGAAHASLLEEVVVTAQKREEALQDVAISLTAFSGNQIEQLGFQSVVDVTAQTPNFNVNGTGGGADSPVMYLNIRGVSFVDGSMTNDPSVSVYLDEVYQAHQGAALNQLFDVERVEVLRGPQGTLFGRNTTGGLIQYITKKPTAEFEGYGAIEYGDYNKQVVEGAVSGPLGEGVRGRLAGRYKTNDGWQENPLNGLDGFGEVETYALRGSLEFDITPDLVALVTAHVADTDNITPGSALYGARNPANLTQMCTTPQIINLECVNGAGFRDPNPKPTRVYSEREEPTTAEGHGGQVRLDWATAAGELVSITGYEKFETDMMQIYPMLGSLQFRYGYYGQAESISQELRLSNETSYGAKWQVGALYYGDERNRRSYSIINGNPSSDPTAQVSTESYSLFSQIDLPVADTVNLVLGMRYTDEERTLDEMFSLIRNFRLELDPIEAKEVTGKVGVEWRPDADTMHYAQFSRGYKSGGYNTASSTADISQLGPVDAEVLYSWEIGSKHTLLDGLMYANGALFYYDFQGYQALVSRTDPNNFGAVEFRFINAGDARIYGGELELALEPHPQWYFSLGVGLLNTHLSADPDLKVEGQPIDGNTLPNSPEYSLNGIARYSIPLAANGEVSVQADFRYQDDVFHNVDNEPFETEEAYGIANLRLGWDNVDGNLRVEAYVENLFDEHYSVQSIRSTSLAASTKNWGLPRWWGVKAKYSF